MERFKPFEKYLFLIVLGFNLIPAFAGNFFPTLDGPAHLYNSNLINELLFGNSTQIHSFFELNTTLIPNWTGHFLLSFFKWFLPSSLAEKGVVLIYLIGLPLAFRGLIFSISPRNSGFSYFVFPLMYSSVFAMGFYNFSLALIVLFYTLKYWSDRYEKKDTWSSLSILFLLLTITYFSHLLVFFLLLFLLGLQILFNTSLEFVLQPKERRSALRKGMIKAAKLLVVAAIPLGMTILYYVHRPISSSGAYLSLDELWNAIKNVSSIIAYNRQEEQMYTRKIFYLFTALVFLVTFNFIYRTIIKKEKQSLKISGYWFLACLSILTLYFVLPDSDDAAGFVSTRLALIFYFFLVVWLASQRTNQYVLFGSLMIVLFFNFKLTKYYKLQIENLNAIAMEVKEASGHIKANSVVLPINYSGNWLLKHFSNYLGIDKPMVILENYEAYMPYFPLVWKDRMVPSLMRDTKNGENNPCLYWQSKSTKSLAKADYIFILEENNYAKDVCAGIIQTELKANYRVQFRSKYVLLYALVK